MRPKISKIKIVSKTVYDVSIGEDRYGYPIRLGRFDRYDDAVNAARKLMNDHELAA